MGATGCSHCRLGTKTATTHGRSSEKAVISRIDYSAAGEVFDVVSGQEAIDIVSESARRIPLRRSHLAGVLGVHADYIALRQRPPASMARETGTFSTTEPKWKSRARERAGIKSSPLLSV